MYAHKYLVLPHEGPNHTVFYIEIQTHSRRQSNPYPQPHTLRLIQLPALKSKSLWQRAVHSLQTKSELRDWCQQKCPTKLSCLPQLQIINYTVVSCLCSYIKCKKIHPISHLTRRPMAHPWFLKCVGVIVNKDVPSRLIRSFVIRHLMAPFPSVRHCWRQSFS